MTSLPDVQQTVPDVRVSLKKVGITNFKIPIKIITKKNEFTNTISNISCFINLDKDLKGINMSRLPLVLQRFQNHSLNNTTLENITKKIIAVSKAEECELNYSFDYFINKTAPISKLEGVVFYPITFTGIRTPDNFIFKFKILITATSLCPCSKEISMYGAHNQKCYIEVEIQPKENAWIWMEDIIKIAESSTSCEIYSVLKRPDEKFVTEEAYENPKFVEDVVRDCYSKLNQRPDIEKFKVIVTSDESIHMHSAVAMIET